MAKTLLHSVIDVVYKDVGVPSFASISVTIGTEVIHEKPRGSDPTPQAVAVSKS